MDRSDAWQSARAEIAGLGPTRKVTPESHGIETAADVAEKAVGAVPGRRCSAFSPRAASQFLGSREP